MDVDIDAAERFILANARLLDRHRLAVLLHGAPVAPVLAALRAYRNPDGGFGHALEPDVRGPESEPTATLHALEVLAGVGALDDPMVADAARWVASVARPDGGVPFVLPVSDAYPRAPFLGSSDEGSFLTFGLAAAFWRAVSPSPWLARATDWCWAELDGAGELHAYGLKWALTFLDAVPDEGRAARVVDGLRRYLAPDGSVPVGGGTADERLTPLVLSPRPGTRSRALFTADQIQADLDRVRAGQREDGGWTFDWLGWSPGQTVETRGAETLRALTTLQAHGALRIHPRSGSTRSPVPERPPAVRQLRLVVEAEDYDGAVAFYRDVLGLREEAAFASGEEARVVILDAGRATLEIVNPAQRRYIDEVEVGRDAAPRIRVAFEVDDGPAVTDRLVAAGATQVAPPTLTPWQSVNSRLDAPADLHITVFQETEDSH